MDDWIRKPWILAVVAAIAINAAVVMNSWQSFGQLTLRTRAFNRSTAIRVDTDQCRKVGQNHPLFAQCVFQFETRGPNTALRFTHGLKVEPADLGIPAIKGDGAITDGHNTMRIDNGQIYLNGEPVEVQHTPSFFLIAKDGRITVDAFDGL